MKPTKMTDSELVGSHHESANMKKPMIALISICGKTHCCISVYYWWNEESTKRIKFQKIWIESHRNPQIHFQDMRKTSINSNWWRITSASETNVRIRTRFCPKNIRTYQTVPFRTGALSFMQNAQFSIWWNFWHFSYISFSFLSQL